MACKKVFVTRRVPTESLVLLKESYEVDVYDSDDPIPRDVLLERVRGCHALFCLLTDTISEEVLDAAGPQLQVVATMSVGCDHLDIKAIRQRNIKIGYTPDVLTNSTAELAVALLLATTRRITEGVASVKNGTWSSWKPLWMCGLTLEGATVGIIGLGRIGFRVLELLQPFKVKDFLYSGRSGEKTGAARLNATYVDHQTLLGSSDVVVVTCALTRETRGLVGAEALRAMKRHAVLVNVSRGEVVDQEELYKALSRGGIAAAGLDVTSPEPLPPHHQLLTLSNIVVLPHISVVLPHIGSATVKARTEMAMLTARNIGAALENQTMPKELRG